jgi:hypothetical protein
MKEKELEKFKKDAQHLQNKQNAIDNLLRLNIQPCKRSVDTIDAFGLKCRICFMSAKFFSLARLCFGTEMDSCRLASSSDV